MSIDACGRMCERRHIVDAAILQSKTAAAPNTTVTVASRSETQLTFTVPLNTSTSHHLIGRAHTAAVVRPTLI